VLYRALFWLMLRRRWGWPPASTRTRKGPAALAALGFGGVELGTITAQAQPGNPKPRMFRLPRDRALLNRLGFNNDGAEVAARRLAGGRAASRCSGSTSARPSSSTRPARSPTTRARPSCWPAAADYLVVNVSSPNTPGLRDLQAVDKLRPLLAEVRATLDRASPTGGCRWW
jgi:dihydroorotate dehydrogenase